MTGVEFIAVAIRKCEQLFLKSVKLVAMSETNCITGEILRTTHNKRKIQWWFFSGIGLLSVVLFIGINVTLSIKNKAVIRKIASDLAPDKLTGTQIRETFAGINHAMMQYHLLGSDGEKEMLDHGIRSFNRILAQSISQPQNEQYKSILQKISKYFDVFLKETRDISSQPIRTIRRDSIALVRQAIDQASAPIWSLIHHVVKSQDHDLSQIRYGMVSTAEVTQSTLNAFLLGWLALATILAGIYNRNFIHQMCGKWIGNETAAERQERLASLGVLAAGVAHEIRNPLAAIKCRLFSLKKELPDNLRENEDLAVIQSEINRLERIVKDFLLFARPSEPSFAIMPGQSILIDVQNLLQPQLAKKAIELKLHLGDPVWIRADKQQLQQALINIVQNAAESIECGGTINLRIKTGSAKLEKRAMPMVVIEVADTGKGIPADAEKRIFDPFYSTKDAGTGLGLPIAARIIEKHGGFIQYQTQQNQGTTFSLMLPRMEQDAQSIATH